MGACACAGGGGVACAAIRAGVGGQLGTSGLAGCLQGRGCVGVKRYDGVERTARRRSEGWGFCGFVCAGGGFGEREREREREKGRWESKSVYERLHVVVGTQCTSSSASSSRVILQSSSSALRPADGGAMVHVCSSTVYSRVCFGCLFVCLFCLEYYVLFICVFCCVSR